MSKALGDETAQPDVSTLLVRILYCREEARLLGLDLAFYLLAVVAADVDHHLRPHDAASHDGAS